MSLPSKSITFPSTAILPPITNYALLLPVVSKAKPSFVEAAFKYTLSSGLAKVNLLPFQTSQARPSAELRSEIDGGVPIELNSIVEFASFAVILKAFP